MSYERPVHPKHKEGLEHNDGEDAVTLIEHGDGLRLQLPCPMCDPAHGRTNDKEES